MSVLTFPAVTPNAAEFALEANTQQTRSELNGVVQTLALPGDRWTANLTFTNLQDPKARIMRAFLASLRGQAGRFYLTPPAYCRAGIGTGTPLVKGPVKPVQALSPTVGRSTRPAWYALAITSTSAMS